ncbi:MAG: rhodanese-like domain-containing protein [Deltaproteobacteria bacterium]|jgi:3-mercaptopyruvate sulfurtransferase SseA|nr:rhodanese-like domain-containing protein [Deltaproteobacteria bacterium]
MWFTIKNYPGLIAIIMMFLFSACFQKTQQEKPATGNETALENESEQKIQIIDTATLKKDFLGKPEVVFIDNRPSHKFKKLGHLPGAVNLPWFEQGHSSNVMTKELLMKHARGKTIVFYCTGALRAWHAAKVAIKWGVPPEKIFWYKAGWNRYSK